MNRQNTVVDKHNKILPPSINNKEKIKPINEKELQINFPYKIGEIELSCQLFKSQLDSEKEMKFNYKQLEKPNIVEEETFYSHHRNKDINIKKKLVTENQIQNILKVEENSNEGVYDQIKIDYDGILVLYLKISDLKPIIIDKALGSEKYHRNYYISHKVFPNRDICYSEIMWNNLKPDFNYQMLMPFSLNSKTIDLIDKGLFLIELWNKGNNVDELLGISKLELSSIIDSLKIAEDLISITPISKSLFPLIICDGYQPVYNYEEMGNICFVNVTLGLGTATQINNFIKKNNTQTFKEGIKEKKLGTNNNNTDYQRNTIDQIEEINRFIEESKRSVEVRNNHDEEINEINNLLNNKSNFNHSSKYQVNLEEDVDVEEILERNRKELEQINSYKLKNTGSSLNDSKKYEGNPFIVTNRDKQEKEKDETLHSQTKQFAISKESNFYLNDKDKELTKFTYNDFNNSKKQKIENSSIPDFNSLCIVERDQINYIPNNQVYSPTFNDAKANTFKITPDQIYTNQEKLNQDSQLIPSIKITNPQKKFNIIKENIESDKEAEYIRKNDLDVSDLCKKQPEHKLNQGYKHTFEIFLEKIYNLQVLAKVKNPFLRYKFLNDDKDTIKSDILVYTSYDKDTSIIELDMKSSHSLILSNLERIKDYLQDFTIELVSDSSNKKEEIIFGRINLPSEEFITLIDNNHVDKNVEDFYTHKYRSTIFIYGTDKIKREDCIIGKMKLEIKYERLLCDVEQENSYGNLLMEKQTVFDRKIPKNATLVIKLNYFKYDHDFLSFFDLNAQGYYFIIDPFGEDKKQKKIFLSKKSSIKRNTINANLEEEFYFDMVMEKEILEHFKSKNLQINLMFTNILKNLNYLDENELSSDNSDSESKNFEEKIGTAKIKLSEVISNADYSNKNFKIISNTSNSILGTVNVDIKLESSNFTPNKKKEIKSKVHFDNLKSNLNEKNSKRLDGKFFFVLNYYELLLDGSFLNSLNDSSKIHKSVKKDSKIFFMFKFGKYKKISQIINLYENLNEIFTNHKIFKRNLNIFEILELNFSFSKNRPDDVINQLIENIFEIKLYLKTEEENINLGSFVIDMSQLLQSESKINEKIYYSDIFNCYCYNFEKKKEESLKMSISFSLIKSDLNINEFKNFYENMKINFDNIQNYQMIKEICKENFNSSVKDNKQAHEWRKLFQINTRGNLLDTNNDYYSYIDIHLINLEDDHGNIIVLNLLHLFRLFMRNYHIVSYINESDEFIHVVSEIFTNKKLNLKNSSDIDVNRYNLSKENLIDVLRSNISVSFDQLDKLIETYNSYLFEKNGKCFSVYANREESTYDLFDFILDFSNFFSFEQILNMHNSFNNYNRKSMLFSIDTEMKSTCSVTIIVYSGTNLTISQTNTQKPNSYFAFSWGNDECISDSVVNTVHPSWNKRIDIEIPNNPISIQSKLSKEIYFKFYSSLNSTNFQTDSYNYNSLTKQYKQGNSNNFYKINNSEITLDPKEELIGNLSFNLGELIQYNFVNLNGEYEGYFNILNGDKIRGQVNLKFLVDQKLLSSRNQFKKSESINNFYSNSYYKNSNNKAENWTKKLNTIDNISNHHHSFSFPYLNSNLALHKEIETLDYKGLWDKLNNNTVNILLLRFN